MKNNCPHKNVQQFTEWCFDCGRNIYETDEEYTRFILQEQQRVLDAQKPKCPHAHVQQFTDICLQCRQNINFVD